MEFVASAEEYFVRHIIKREADNDWTEVAETVLSIIFSIRASRLKRNSGKLSLWFYQEIKKGTVQ